MVWFFFHLLVVCWFVLGQGGSTVFVSAVAGAYTDTGVPSTFCCQLGIWSRASVIYALQAAMSRGDSGEGMTKFFFFAFPKAQEPALWDATIHTCMVCRLGLPSAVWVFRVKTMGLWPGARVAIEGIGVYKVCLFFKFT